MAQGINPTLGTTRHPNTSSPVGQKTMTIASCTPAVGAPYFGAPFLVYPVPGHKHLGGDGTETKGRVRQVPPAVAAADLAWWPTSPAPRLATDLEVTDYLAARDLTFNPARGKTTI